MMRLCFFCNPERVAARILTLGVLLIVATMMASCLPSEEEPTIVVDDFGSTYHGKWNVEGVEGGDGKLFVDSRNFFFDSLPAEEIARAVWKNDDVVDAVCGPCIVGYGSVASSGTNVIYSLADAEWEVKANVGGMERTASLCLKSMASALDGQSWAACAKNSGVMTVFLHVDVCSEEGVVQPMKMTLTFTGAPADSSEKHVKK